MKYTHYVALGDSMSIDLYPSLDLDADVEELPIGAASLLYRNHDATWSKMSGVDLSTRFPGIEFVNLAADGARTIDVQGPQLAKMRARVPAGSAAVVTLTAGGNDLLLAFDADDHLDRAARDAALHVQRCVEAIVTHLPDAIVLVTTVYDPTDGSGVLPGDAETLGELPVEYLFDFNDRVRDLADGDRVRVADAQRHFRGWGADAAVGERWYWPENPIEPGARGAHELRRLWLETLNGAGEAG
jgi:lysophospholipase L1-like esterase